MGGEGSQASHRYPVGVWGWSFYVPKKKSYIQITISKLNSCNLGWLLWLRNHKIEMFLARTREKKNQCQQ